MRQSKYKNKKSTTQDPQQNQNLSPKPPRYLCGFIKSKGAKKFMENSNAIQHTSPDTDTTYTTQTPKGRKRNVQLIIRVTADEKDFINKKMEQFGTANFNAYARKMLIDGYVIHVDLTEFQTLAAEVNAIGTNINQIAKISNTTGMIFGDDIEKLKEMMNEVWQLLKSSLSGLLSKSR